MKIVFFGSDIFAVPSLEALVRNKFEVTAVVTQTDKKRGRHLNLGFSAVKEATLRLGLNILQPEKLSDPDFISAIKYRQTDLLVVAAYGKILNKTILNIPKIMPINIHGSLLPKYRGAAPINWAIINGEKETGVTLMRMNELMDAGEIISQGAVRIEKEDDAITLRKKLSALGSEELLKVINHIQQGKKIPLTVQDEKLATSAPKLKKSDGLIDWHRDAISIHNRIRGLRPWPGCFTHYKQKALKILSSEVSGSEAAKATPGEVVDVSKDGVKIATGKGSLIIKTVQLESARPMSAWQFIAGHRIDAGFSFLS